MNEKIKAVLGEELSKQVEEKLGTANIEIGVTNDGTLVSADKHDSMKAEFKATQDELAKAQKSMKDLEASTGTIEELKAELKTKGEEFETFKAETEKRESNSKKKMALEKVFNGKVAKGAIDLLVETYDLDKIQVDSKGNVVDSDVLLKELEETRKDLLIETKIDDPAPPNGESKGVIDWDKLTDEEYLIKKKEQNKKE